MLWAIGSVFLLLVGGSVGVALVSNANDAALQEPYYVVAHLHFLLQIGAIFTGFGILYFWLPKMMGYLYNEGLARWHFWIMFLGVNASISPPVFMEFTGTPRRYSDYADTLSIWNLFSAIGALFAGHGLLIFVAVLIEARVRKRA